MYKICFQLFQHSYFQHPLIISILLINIPSYISIPVNMDTIYFFPQTERIALFCLFISQIWIFNNICFQVGLLALVSTESVLSAFHLYAQPQLLSPPFTLYLDHL